MMGMGNSTEPPLPAVATRAIFVVRLSDDTGQAAGVVERVRTGQKARFASLDELGAVIDRMRRDEATTDAASAHHSHPRGGTA